MKAKEAKPRKAYVRKTITHGRSLPRPQHVYLRMTDKARSRYNRLLGGFKHYVGAKVTGADIFEAYALPAMEAVLKAIADKAKGKEANND